MDLFEKVIVGVLVFLGAVLAALMFVYVPAGLYTEAECLRNGFPKAHVTIGLERYCSTLDGSVTVKVKKQS